MLFHQYNYYVITKDLRSKLELIRPKLFCCNTNLASPVYLIKIFLQKQNKKKKQNKRLKTEDTYIKCLIWKSLFINLINTNALVYWESYFFSLK